ncbi:MAG: serine/threonine protein phosphatase [Chitinophagaceae bacterium]|nr:MAG: serine/threonine protein phosphatase [Chitinophagaceae bacterium]
MLAQSPKSNDKLSELERLLTIKQMQINSLLEVSQAINNNFSTKAIFRIYEFILKAQIGVNKMAVFIKDDEWEIGAESGVNKKETLQSINANHYFKDIKSVSKLKKDTYPELEEFEFVIPTYHKDEPLSYLLIGELKTDNYDTIEEKLKFIMTITNIIVVAIENKKLFKNQIDRELIKRELEIAAKMQSMLIPDSLPKNEFIEMAAIYIPNQDIGGDIYDYVKLSDEEFAFCIGDVSGKGVAAALLMSNFQANFQIIINEKGSLESYIKNLNRRLLSITKGEKFITLFLGIYNTKTKKLKYVNAGHNPPILVNKGKLIELDKGTTILGMFEELPFVNEGEVSLEKNSLLLTYTDGLVDIENEENEMFDIERVKDFLKEYQHLTVHEFNSNLFKYIESFKGTQLFLDDITILSCRFF